MKYEKLRQGISWKYQQDNHPKQTANAVQQKFMDHHVRVFEWPTISLIVHL